ncbi:unnamed protein product [Caenorhabditis bovis]|uniref:Nucleotide-diphospho-sugar transferase domain-containing protein n=1 Tax=Caenorhabditis bovis TaxID=2654633 RepID=A0A8S1F714_9PELO|nr:unnamed protein product [Caenorhabditis bovis]
MVVSSSSSWPIFAVFSILAIVLLFKAITTISEDRYFRQRRIIEKLNELAELMPPIENPQFLEFVNLLKTMKEAPMIIFYDSSNIDILRNHICNLKFIPNTLPRLATISFDRQGFEMVSSEYPQIPNILIDLEPLKSQLSSNVQNRGYIIYQLILMTRARICAALARNSLDFWAMQQDSIWTGNLVGMRLDTRFPDANLIFDTVGNDQIYNRMRGWICGSTFFVRAGVVSTQFFEQVERLMRHRQSPDSAIMTYLCGNRKYKCQKLPHWIISSSDYFLAKRDIVPVVVQVDADQKAMSKMELFKKSRFVFRHKNGTCDTSAFVRIRHSIRNALKDKMLADPRSPEPLRTRIWYKLRSLLNIDPYNNKRFLQVHESLI